jgi:hypothetical protein
MTIVIDIDAAGWGWRTNPASPVGSASIDLLSVLAHELGHVLGLAHTDEGLMGEVIEPGVRELPSLTVDHALPPASISTDHVTAVHPVDPIATGVPVIEVATERTIAASPYSIGVSVVAFEGAIAPSLVERAAMAVSEATPAGHNSRVPLAPMSMWWLMLGLAVALATLRRWRLLRAPRR